MRSTTARNVTSFYDPAPFVSRFPADSQGLFFFFFFFFERMRLILPLESRRQSTVMQDNWKTATQLLFALMIAHVSPCFRSSAPLPINSLFLLKYYIFCRRLWQSLNCACAAEAGRAVVGWQQCVACIWPRQTATDPWWKIWFSGGGCSHLVALPFEAFNINLQKKRGWSLGCVALKLSLRLKVPRKIICMLLMLRQDSQTFNTQKHSQSRCCHVLPEQIRSVGTLRTIPHRGPLRIICCQSI